MHSTKRKSEIVYFIPCYDFCFETVIHYFYVFCGNDIFEDCSPVILINVLDLDLSVFFSELNSACSIVQEYESDVYLSASHEDAHGICFSLLMVLMLITWLKIVSAW